MFKEDKYILIGVTIFINFLDRFLVRIFMAFLPGLVLALLLNLSEGMQILLPMILAALWAISDLCRGAKIE